MSNSLWVRFRSNSANIQEDSWWARVSENARAFFETRGTPQLAPSGAVTFDLLDARPAPGTRQRQAVSLLVHGVAIGVLVWLGGSAVKRIGEGPQIFTDHGPLRYFKPQKPMDRPIGGQGAGGDQNPLPPTKGDWAARSATVLLHPRLPDELKHVLPVEVTIYDPKLNELRHVDDLGIPSMPERNNSNGQNGRNSIGNQPGNTMGTTTDGTGGESYEPGARGYAPYPVVCVYCPNPEYTDEARHEKLQGSVELQVLVSKDGRAAQIRIVKGLGLGLDERAIAAVRNWKFQPARDANKAAIPQWVTVEATYRLF